MRIEQLQYIVEIAQTGSFTIAAQQLNVSQPNLSQAVSALEDELGVKLFHRSRTGAQATDAGREIILKAIEILTKVEELRESADIQTSLLSGRLSIAAIPTLSVTLLPKALSAFKNKYPKVELEIREDHAQQIIEDLLQGEVDIGLIAVPPDQSLDTAKLELRTFMHSKILACVGKNTDFARQSQISMKEIIRQPLISTSAYVKEALKKYGEPNLLFKSRILEAAKHVIAEGVAIGFYTELALKFDPHVQAGDLVPLPIIEENLELSFSWAYNKKRYTVASRQFLKELEVQIVHMKRIYHV